MSSGAKRMNKELTRMTVEQPVGRKEEINLRRVGFDLGIRKYTVERYK